MRNLKSISKQIQVKRFRKINPEKYSTTKSSQNEDSDKENIDHFKPPKWPQLDLETVH